MHGEAAYWNGQLSSSPVSAWRSGQAPVLVFIAATVPLVDYTIRVGGTDKAQGSLQLPASLVLPPGATLSLSLALGTAEALVIPDPRGSAWGS